MLLDRGSTTGMHTASVLKGEGVNRPSCAVA